MGETDVPQLDSLLHQQLILSTGPNSVASVFQFELRGRTRASADGEFREQHYIVERNGPKFGVLMLSGDRLPYALLSSGRFVLLDRERPGDFRILQGRGLQCGWGPPGIRWQLGSPDNEDDSWGRFNLTELMQQFRSEEVTCRFEQRARTLYFRKATGATARIVINTDPRGFPITELSMTSSQGDSATLTNFQVGTPPARSILEIRGELEPVRITRSATADQVSQELARLGLRGTHDDAKSKAAALMLLGLFAVDRSAALFPGQSERVREALDVLRGEVADRDALAVALDDLAGSVRRVAVEPLQAGGIHIEEVALDRIRAATAGRKPPRRIAPPKLDYPRGLARCRLEAAFGPELASDCLLALKTLIANPHADAGQRSSALVLLGDIGAPSAADWDEISTAVERGADAALAEAAAAARARAGEPRDRDVERLRAGLSNREAPLASRYAALEALGLVDELAGQEQAVQTLLSPESAEHAPEPLLRYISAAGSAPSGRNVLLGCLTEEFHHLPQADIAIMLAQRIAVGDAARPRFLQAMRVLALDEGADASARDLAWRIYLNANQSDREFADRFVRSALATNSPVLVQSAAVAADVLKTARGYLPEIEELLDSPDAELRLSAAMCCFAAATQAPPELQGGVFYRVLTKVATDKSYPVSDLGLATLCKLSEAGAKLPNSCLRSVVGSFGREPIPERMAAIAPALELLTGGRLDLGCPKDADGRVATDAPSLKWWKEHAAEVRQKARTWADEHLSEPRGG
jgi:hypothetical protein